MGTLGSVWHHIQHVHALTSGQEGKHFQPGGSMVLDFKIPVNTSQVKTLVMHDGRLLSGISAAYPFLNIEGKKHVVHGSWCEYGVLVCPIN